MSFQPPPPGNPPPPPPGGWPPPPPAGGQPPPPPPPGYGAPPPVGGPPTWAPPPTPPKKSRKGLIIGLAIGAAVVLILIVVALASVADKVSGGTSLSDLKRGDCFNTTKALVADKAVRVPCSEPHTDEVAGVLTFPAPDGAGYPGQSGILEFGKTDCLQQVTDFYGNKEPSATTQIFVFGPNDAAWRNGDRTVVCSLREEPPVKRTGSYLEG